MIFAPWARTNQAIVDMLRRAQLTPDERVEVERAAVLVSEVEDVNRRSSGCRRAFIPHDVRDRLIELERKYRKKRAVKPTVDRIANGRRSIPKAEYDRHVPANKAAVAALDAMRAALPMVPPGRRVG